MKIQDYEDRALAAYFRRFDNPPQPCSPTLEELNGEHYVVLANNYRTLAVYRILPNDRLQYLESWPQELDVEYNTYNT